MDYSKKPYEGSIFDVQSHAMVPGPGVEKAKAAIDPQAPQAIRAILCRIYDQMADNLSGPLRLTALGTDNIQVITLQMGFSANMPSGMLIHLVSSINDWLAERTSSNSQLIGIATIAPPQVLDASNTQANLDLLHSAISNLRLKGLLMSNQYDSVFLGDPVYAPYFTLAEDMGIPIIIHPSVTPTKCRLANPGMLPITTFYMNDQRTAILDLVQAGVLENHPNLKIIATHLGGGVLGLMGRIEQLAEVLPAEQLYIDLRGQKKKLPNLINYYLKKIYYDCNNADATDIIAAAGKVGIDHLLTGTDFPFIPESFTRLVLANCPFSEKEKEAIAYNNAARLFGMNPIDQ